MRFRIEERENPQTHSLTITESDHGTVTAIPEGPYTAGTEVTLTATPNEGYQFSKWLIGEEEFTDNPLTFTIEADTTVTPTFEPTTVEVVLYDNTMFEAKPPQGAPPNAQPPWATRGDTHLAQQFYTGEADNVSSVELTIKRTGNPGGSISFEIWDTAEDGFPGKIVGVLSEIEVNNLPAELQTIEIPGTVTGLQPMTRYYFVYRNIDIDFNASWNLDDSTVGARTYHLPTLFDGLNGGPGPASHPPEGEPLQEFIFRSNGQDAWKTISYPVPLPPGFIHMRIAAAPSHTLTVTPSDNGTVTADPDMPTYPAGTEVTLTATPNDSYELAKWLIGEDEFTDNPLTFTIEANTMVFAEFVDAPGESVLYGNIPISLPPDGSSWIFPHKGDLAQAQSFATGASGLISSVRLPLTRWGSPGGVVHAEIWSDDGGKPDTKVATIADIDLRMLATTPGEILHFDNLNVQLEPQTLYHFVLDNSDAIIVDSPRSTYTVLTNSSDEGTMGAGKLMVTTPVWTPLENFLNHAKYLRFEIVETNSAGDMFSLTITPNDHGTVTASPGSPYTAGTEVTLTATPNKGYQFSKWFIGEDEFTDNPLTFTIEADTTVTPEFAESNQIIHFSNLDDPGNPNEGFKSFKIGPAPGEGGAAQRFTAGEAGNVASVTFGLARVGSPGGNMIVSIREAAQNGYPGAEIGVLGETPINDARIMAWPPNIDLLNLVTVEGLVDGLVPGEDYLVYIVHDDEARIVGGAGPTHVPFVDAVQSPQVATPVAVEWPNWKRPWNDLRLRVQIEGSPAAPTSNDPFIIDKTEEGSVTADPNLDTYPIGSQVTVSATPEPGFEFVKWLYGDEEFTTNPATITVVAGATLTPKFAPVESEPKPIDVEILPAMAIRWDSQVGRTYEVQSSPNLQDWTVEAENVQGTGDTLTHFFIRDAREMYYRVMEN